MPYPVYLALAGGGVSITLNDQFVDDSSFSSTSPVTVTSTYTLNTVGNVLMGTNHSGNQVDKWASGSFNSSQYEVFFTSDNTTGFSSSGLNTWLSLATNKFMQLTRTSTGTSASATCTVQIRLKDTTTVIAACNVVLSVAVGNLQ